MKKADIVIKFRELAHPRFKRQGDNLIYFHKISLSDALKSIPISFETIDGEVIKLSAPEVVSPDTTIELPGKGMPILDDNPLGPIKKSFQRGDLFVKFDIEFPRYLSEDKKQELTAILDENEH